MVNVTWHNLSKSNKMGEQPNFKETQLKNSQHFSTRNWLRGTEFGDTLSIKNVLISTDLIEV